MKVSGELYDAGLRNLFLSDHEAVDAILRRKCREMGYVSIVLCQRDVLLGYWMHQSRLQWEM